MRISPKEPDLHRAYAVAVSSVYGDSYAKRSSVQGPVRDQVDISQSVSGSQTQFQKELASRLVQSVRTATSTGTVQQVRAQIQAGSYQINPEKIAAAMLLEVDDGS